MFSIWIRIYTFHSCIDFVWDWWTCLQPIDLTAEKQFWRGMWLTLSPNILKVKRYFIFIQTIEYAASAAEQDDFATESDDIIRQVQTIFQLFLQLLTSIHQKSLETDEYCLSHMEHALCHALYFLNQTTASTLFHRYVLSSKISARNQKIRKIFSTLMWWFWTSVFCKFSDNDIRALLDSMQLTIFNVTTSPKCQIDEFQLCRKGTPTIIRIYSPSPCVLSSTFTFCSFYIICSSNWIGWIGIVAKWHKVNC